MRGLLQRSGTSCQQKLATPGATVIDGTTNDIPQPRQPLPLIYENGLFRADNAFRRSLQQFPRAQIIQSKNGSRPLSCGRSLPHTFRPIKCNSGKVWEQFV